MSFFGKQYVLDSQENFDGFVNTLGNEIPEDYKKALINFKASAKLEKNGDTFTLTTSIPTNPSKQLTFKSGVEFEEDIIGHQVKTTIKLDGNVLTQVQRYEDGVEFNFKREFSDNQMIMTITRTGWDGVAKRVYKAA